MKPATISRCFGGHVDEARALMAEGDRGDLTDVPEDIAATPPYRIADAGESVNSMVSLLPNGAWLVSLACWRCGFLGGFSANQASAQQAIHDWQNGHVIECRGEALL